MCIQANQLQRKWLLVDSKCEENSSKKGKLHLFALSFTSFKAYTSLGSFVSVPEDTWKNDCMVAGCPISADDLYVKVECSGISMLVATCRCVMQYVTFLQSDWPH